MNKTLTALYDSFYTPPQAANTREEINTIHKHLILKLGKPERRLANELNSYPESGRPTQSGQTERDTVVRCRSDGNSRRGVNTPPRP